MMVVKSLLAVSLILIPLAQTPAWAEDEARLDQVMAARPDEDKVRDQYRNPKETLLFFGVEPGMTVVETFPGGGWYTKILVPYLGPDGRYIAADYTIDVFEKNYRYLLGDFPADQRAFFESFPERFPAFVKQLTDTPPATDTFFINHAPANLNGAVDVILFIRVLHNLNRFDRSELDGAAAEAFRLLKPGGVAGVVQHRAQPDMPDDWADGNNGYLKEARVIDAFEGAGFELEATANFNANPKDRPSTDEYVWRLPPVSFGCGENCAAYEAIGESDRMTMRFRKPK